MFAHRACSQTERPPHQICRDGYPHPSAQDTSNCMNIADPNEAHSGIGSDDLMFMAMEKSESNLWVIITKYSLILYQLSLIHLLYKTHHAVENLSS